MVAVNIPKFRRRGTESSAVGTPGVDSSMAQAFQNISQKVESVGRASQKAALAEGAVFQAAAGVIGDTAKLMAQRQLIIEKNEATTKVAEMGITLDNTGNTILKSFTGDKQKAMEDLELGYTESRDAALDNVNGKAGKKMFSRMSDTQFLAYKKAFSGRLDAANDDLAVQRTSSALASMEQSIINSKSRQEAEVGFSKMSGYFNANANIIGGDIVAKFGVRANRAVEGFVYNTMMDDPLRAIEILNDKSSVAQFLKPEKRKSMLADAKRESIKFLQRENLKILFNDMQLSKVMADAWSAGDHVLVAQLSVKNVQAQRLKVEALKEAEASPERVHDALVNLRTRESELKIYNRINNTKSDYTTFLGQHAKLIEILKEESFLEYYDKKTEKPSPKKIRKILDYDTAFVAFRKLAKFREQTSDLAAAGLISGHEYGTLVGIGSSLDTILSVARNELTKKEDPISLNQPGISLGLTATNPIGGAFHLLSVIRASAVNSASRDSAAYIHEKLKMAFPDIMVRDQLEAAALVDFYTGFNDLVREKGTKTSRIEIETLRDQILNDIVYINNPRYVPGVRNIDNSAEIEDAKQ